MGVHRNITATTFPRQGPLLGQRCRVVFHYDIAVEVDGTIIRDDIEDPGVTIIALGEGRFVLGTECQYMPLNWG